MGAKGLDFAWSRPSATAMANAGYTFACRYLSYDHTKNLTLAEAQANALAGVDTVANWEYAVRAPLNGAWQGTQDARTALGQAQACGMPNGRPIYFSVDFDATEAQQGPINQYLMACANVLGGPHFVGVYGGYYIVKRALDAGVAQWGWQTYAWSGGQWDPRAKVRQVRNGVQFAGADVDINEAQVADFGQWRPGQSPHPDTNGDDMTPLQAQQLQDLWAWLAEVITDDDVSNRPEDRFKFHNPLRARLQRIEEKLTVLQSQPISAADVAAELIRQLGAK